MTPNQVKWVAKGRKRSNPSNVTSPIDIQESETRVQTTPGDPPYGMPIDTPLAIEMIRNLWKAIDTDRLFALQEEYNNLLKQFTEKSDLDKGVKAKMAKLVETNAEWLETLLKYSFSITFDRNLILKLLSQAGCEGVRFYLCLKKEKSNKIDLGNLSLVSVGVDIKGRDLNYEYDKNKHDLNDIPNIENCSLDGEYAKILGKDPFDQSATSEDDIRPYVLFKFANHKFKYNKT